MALNANALGQALATAAGISDTVGIAAWVAIATALVNHITTNAVVLPTGTPPMSNSGGPVTGTGKIT